MGEAIGAATIDLEWVQVHPTGLVKPDDADAKVKFLAAEALRGVGGILIDAKGERFANELGRRDYVTGRMWKNKPPFRLMLNSKAANEIHWHCEHYKGRGVMQYCMGGLEIDADSRVVKKVGNNMVAIDGLYAAGEIAGGVHGNNRLGGNSLLDCVVFGRVAGKHAAL